MCIFKAIPINSVSLVRGTTVGMQMAPLSADTLLVGYFVTIMAMGEMRIITSAISGGQRRAANK